MMQDFIQIETAKKYFFKLLDDLRSINFDVITFRVLNHLLPMFQNKK